jgi:hypothetical protein
VQRWCTDPVVAACVITRAERFVGSVYEGAFAGDLRTGIMGFEAGGLQSLELHVHRISGIATEVDPPLESLPVTTLAED